MITLELSPEQAETAIRDLHRAVTHLDRSVRFSENPVERGACIAISNRLVDLAERIEAAQTGARR